MGDGFVCGEDCAAVKVPESVKAIRARRIFRRGDLEHEVRCMETPFVNGYGKRESRVGGRPCKALERERRQRGTYFRSLYRPKSVRCGAGNVNSRRISKSETLRYLVQAGAVAYVPANPGSTKMVLLLHWPGSSQAAE